jgi:membrane protease YdiL (CAAX protease family)
VLQQHSYLIVLAAAWGLVLPLSLAFAGDKVTTVLKSLPLAVRLLLPCCLAVPYLLVSVSREVFQVHWLIIYALMPVLIALVLWRAHEHDPEQLGYWLDFAVLLILGLVVEFRRFEPAWPPHLAAFNRIILLDAGLYGFLVIRELSNVGFDLRPRFSDWKNGMRELIFYAPIAVPLGLALGFLHLHLAWPGLAHLMVSFVSIFFLIAMLEETYFRGWWQNLLERRLGPNLALLTTATLFGLSHFNKGATAFNWRYVLLATLAGVFYGRAWRSEHRIFASAITHACVDTIWLLWLR